MAIYLANENGDWWEYKPNQALWILNTDDLSAEQLQDITENWGPIDGSEDLPEKLERVIWKYGHPLYLEPLDLVIKPEWRLS